MAPFVFTRRSIPGVVCGAICGAIFAATLMPGWVTIPSRALPQQIEAKGSNQSSSSAPAAAAFPAAPQPRLTLCTMANNDLPYLPEWIEFHMTGGFSNIFICDDGSDDNSTSVLDLYKGRNKGYVHMVPSPVLKGGIPGQIACYAACKEATLSFTDWWFVGDTDEYLHSQSHGSVAAYLATLPPGTSHLTVEPVRFGVRDLEVGRFRNELQRVNGTDRLQYCAPEGGEAQLISQTQVHRGASKDFGEPEKEIQAAFPCCAKKARNDWELCNNGLGKSLARGAASTMLGLHVHGTSGATLLVKAENLRIYHYYTRSEEDARLKAAKWHKTDPEDVFKESNDYWTAIEDRSLQRYGAALKLRMNELRN